MTGGNEICSYCFKILNGSLIYDFNILDIGIYRTCIDCCSILKNMLELYNVDDLTFIIKTKSSYVFATYLEKYDYPVKYGVCLCPDGLADVHKRGFLNQGSTDEEITHEIIGNKYLHLKFKSNEVKTFEIEPNTFQTVKKYLSGKSPCIIYGSNHKNRFKGGSITINKHLERFVNPSSEKYMIWSNSRNDLFLQMEKFFYNKFKNVIWKSTPEFINLLQNRKNILLKKLDDYISLINNI